MKAHGLTYYVSASGKTYLKKYTEKHFYWRKMVAGWKLGITANYSYYADLTQILSVVIVLTKD